MIFKAQKQYNTIEDRLSLAKNLSCIVQGDKSNDLPYCPNDDGDHFVLDNHNDWFLNFDWQNRSEFSIRYRYNSAINDKEKALATWLLVRYSALTLKD